MKLKLQFNGENYYYLGKKDNVYYYLQEPSFDCGWYWGLNYLEGFEKKDLSSVDDIISHEHFMGSNDRNWIDWLTKDIKSPLSETAKWQILEICQSLKTLREYMDLCHIGGSHISSSSKTSSILKDDEAYASTDKKIRDIIEIFHKIFEEEQERLEK